ALTVYVTPGGLTTTRLEPLLKPVLQLVAASLEDDFEPERNRLRVAAHLGVARWLPDQAAPLGQKTQNFQPYFKDSQASNDPFITLYKINNSTHKNVAGLKTSEYFAIIGFPGSSYATTKGFEAIRRELSYVIGHLDELKPRGLMIEKAHFPHLPNQISETKTLQAQVPHGLTTAMVNMAAAITHQRSEEMKAALSNKRKEGQASMANEYGETYNAVVNAHGDAQDLKRMAMTKAAGYGEEGRDWVEYENEDPLSATKFP
ncbi:hypothetical protein B484DRAFT_472445, partial [Ochromonadaceae sp. CCMP2298]